MAPAGPPTEAERRALWLLGMLGPAETAAMPPHAWQRLRFARWLYATGRLREAGEARQTSGR